MATTPHLQTVTLWLSKLALLTVGGKTPPTKQQIGLYAMTLAAELPLGAFTEASLKEVANGCEFFPAYSVVKTALEAWHATERVRSLSSPVSDAVRRRLDEMQDNDAHRDRVSDRMADAKSDWADPVKVRESVRNIGEDHPHRLDMGRILFSLVKQHAPLNIWHIPPEFHH